MERVFFFFLRALRSQRKSLLFFMSRFFHFHKLQKAIKAARPHRGGERGRARAPISFSFSFLSFLVCFLSLSFFSFLKRGIVTTHRKKIGIVFWRKTKRWLKKNEKKKKNTHTAVRPEQFLDDSINKEENHERVWVGVEYISCSCVPPEIKGVLLLFLLLLRRARGEGLRGWRTKFFSFLPKLGGKKSPPFSSFPRERRKTTRMKKGDVYKKGYAGARGD